MRLENLPPVPSKTRIYQRVLQERRCAELAKAAYDYGVTADSRVEWFTFPHGSPNPMLVALGFVEEGQAFLSFRGTVSLRNWLSDFHCATTGGPARHSGFEHCWQRLRPQVEAWLEATQPANLTIVGHSLGGAMAQLAAMAIAARWRIERVVCFGAPLVGRKNFTAFYDGTTIFGRIDAKLGDVTTTFVFKTDLVRSFALPSLGFVRNGQEVVIDEHGLPSGNLLPWNVEALSRTTDLFLGPDQGPATAVFYADRLGIAGLSRRAPSTGVLATIDSLRPYAAPVIRVFPKLQLALLAIAALTASISAGIFFRRDAEYHSVKERYVKAMSERVQRWVPSAFHEFATDLLGRGDASAALSYFEAAIRSAESDPCLANASAAALRSWIWPAHVGRASALIGLGRAEEALADLTALVDSYGTDRVRLGVSAVGHVAASPQLTLLQYRAMAREAARHWREAIEDYQRIVGTRPDLDFATFMEIGDAARKRVGVQGQLAALLGVRKSLVDAESRRLQEARDVAFRAALAPIFAWAHAHWALCAYRLQDYEVVIAQASESLILDPSDASLFHLRGAANARLKRRDQAVADMSRAIELDPSQGRFFYGRANTLLMVGSTIVPAEAGSKVATIELQLTVGEKEMVEADLNTALQLDPSHAMAKALLEAVRGAQYCAADSPPSVHRAIVESADSFKSSSPDHR